MLKVINECDEFFADDFRIIIKATQKYRLGFENKLDLSWIYYLWQRSRGIVISKYSKNGWNVSYSTADIQRVDGAFDLRQDILTISKRLSEKTQSV